AASGKEANCEIPESLPQDGRGAAEDLCKRHRAGRRVGDSSDHAVPVAETAGAGGRRARTSGNVEGTRAEDGSQTVEAGAGGKDAGGGFFRRCLAKNRGSTSEQRRLWREGVYDQIREVMPMQGSLSIERMC